MNILKILKQAIQKKKKPETSLYVVYVYFEESLPPDEFLFPVPIGATEIQTYAEFVQKVPSKGDCYKVTLCYRWKGKTYYKTWEIYVPFDANVQTSYKKWTLRDEELTI